MNRRLTFAAIAISLMAVVQPTFARPAKPSSKPVEVVIDADGDKDFVKVIYANGDWDISGGPDFTKAAAQQ